MAAMFDFTATVIYQYLLIAIIQTAEDHLLPAGFHSLFPSDLFARLMMVFPIHYDCIFKAIASWQLHEKIYPL
jgi:hypothetical protein